MVFIGAENIVSPLGNSAAENYAHISEGKTAVSVKPIGVNQEGFAVASFEDKKDLLGLCLRSFEESLTHVDRDKIEGKTALIFSSTKGEINALNERMAPYSISALSKKLSEPYPFISETFTISNACVSGIMALNLGRDLIQGGNFDHVVVVGGDLASDFTVAGFQAFFAMSDEVCRPYDKDRKGINLGEAASTVWLSKSNTIFRGDAFYVLGGATRNDANHISGPSRTGEGLFRAFEAAKRSAQIQVKDLDYICSHGTATNYNDEMESQAFKRANLLEVPMNSLKGYFGHTLGAAGLVEASIALQSIRHQKLVASLGFEFSGVSYPLNVIDRSRPQSIKTIVKTGSGFGGCNSAIVISKQPKKEIVQLDGPIALLGEVTINQEQVTVNDQVKLKLGEDPLREMYDDLELNYSKFHKMDPLCKLGVLGVEYLLGALPELKNAGDEEVGLVIESKWGSSFSDLAHQKQLELKNPSPAIFVYTLPNIVLGEISIKHKWYGESICLISEGSGEQSKAVADLYLKMGKIKYALQGNIEYIEGSFELSLSAWAKKA